MPEVLIAAIEDTASICTPEASASAVISIAAGALSLVLYSVVLAVPMSTERLVNGAGAEFLSGPASAQVLVLCVPVLGYVLIAAVRSKILAALVATVGSSLMSATFGRLITLP